MRQGARSRHGAKLVAFFRVQQQGWFGSSHWHCGEGACGHCETGDSENKHDVEKQNYVEKFDLKHVAAFGNGNNDRLLLKTVKEGGGLAVAVDNGEGCAIDALLNANLFIVGALNGLNLLEPRSCKATLRF